jgi:hypothetical protein
MFNFFKKKDIKIYPVKASQSIASLALLIDSQGYPFSDEEKDFVNSKIRLFSVL